MPFVASVGKLTKVRQVKAKTRSLDVARSGNPETVVCAIRILYKDLLFTAGQRSAIVVGNPEEVADYFQLWFEAEAADGFNIFPAYVPDAVDAFARLVVPISQERGLFRRDYDGTTFRDHLKLQRPPNSFSSSLSQPIAVVA